MALEIMNFVGLHAPTAISEVFLTLWRNHSPYKNIWDCHAQRYADRDVVQRYDQRSADTKAHA